MNIDKSMSHDNECSGGQEAQISRKVAQLEEESSSLKEQVSQLEEENAELRRNLEQVRTERENESSLTDSSENEDLTSSFGGMGISGQPAGGDLPSQIPPHSSSSPMESTAAPINSTSMVFGYVIDANGEVDLGHGTKVSATKLKEVMKNSARTTTHKLMELVFNHDELMKATFSGQRSRGSKTQELDKNKVMDITAFIQKVCPVGLTDEDIKKFITKKLTEYKYPKKNDQSSHQQS